MTGPSASLALAGFILVASAVLFIALVPILDAELRRRVLRRLAANDNATGTKRECVRKVG